MKGDKDSAGFVEDVCEECGKVVYTLPEFFYAYGGIKKILCWDCQCKSTPAVEEEAIVEVQQVMVESEENTEMQKRIDAMDGVF